MQIMPIREIQSLGATSLNNLLNYKERITTATIILVPNPISVVHMRVQNLEVHTGQSLVTAKIIIHQISMWLKNAGLHSQQKKQVLFIQRNRVCVRRMTKRVMGCPRGLIFTPKAKTSHEIHPSHITVAIVIVAMAANQEPIRDKVTCMLNNKEPIRDRVTFTMNPHDPIQVKVIYHPRVVHILIGIREIAILKLPTKVTANLTLIVPPLRLSTSQTVIRVIVEAEVVHI